MATAWERSDDQRREALRRANEVRSRRSKLKCSLAAGEGSALTIIESPPPWCATMPALDLLLAVRGIGRVKARNMLSAVGISPSRTLAGLTPRQRRELLAALSSRVNGPDR